MRQSATILGLACIAFAAGCASHRVQADGVGRLGGPMQVLVKADTVSKPSITIWSLFWGIASSPQEVSLACGKNFGLKEVVTKSTPGYTLITVLTLGMVSPRKFEAYCATTRPTPGGVPSPGGVPTPAEVH